MDLRDTKTDKLGWTDPAPALWAGLSRLARLFDPQDTPPCPPPRDSESPSKSRSQKPQKQQKQENPRRYAQLDSLRAFAVGIVMIHHFRDQPFFLSGFGASLFLVLSGYFATKSLIRLREAAFQAPGAASLGPGAALTGTGAALKSFYIQRSLRLFPLYYLVLFLTFAFNIEYARQSFFWNATFLSNFRILLTGEWNGRFSPLWSLSLLEQFYLIWPAVILFCPKRLLAPLTLLVIFAAPVYRLACLGLALPPLYWCVAPLASLDQLGTGALLALCSGGWVSSSFSRHLKTFCGIICVPLFALLLICKAAGITPIGCAIYIPLVASLAFLWVVKKAESGFEGPVRVLLENRFLGHVGRMSYSIFLLHTFAELLVPPLGFLQPLLHSDLRLLILIPTTLLLSHCSYCLIERPIQVLRKKWRPQLPQVATAVAPAGSALAGL